MKSEKIFLMLILALFIYLSFVMIKPFLPYILSSFILTFITYPVYKFVRKYLKNHTISAFLVILLIFFVVLMPSIYLATTIFQQSLNIINQIKGMEIERFNFTELENTIFQVTGQRIDVESRIRESILTLGNYIAQESLRFLGKLSHALLGLFIMFFIMYYLYKDGEKLLEYLKILIPMDDVHKDLLINSSKRVVWALLMGHFLIAIIQGILSTILYVIFGLPNAIFWGFVTILIAIFPFFGAHIVFIPASIYMFVQGNTVSGLGILLGGLIIVSNVDNLIRPKFVHSRANIHPVFVLLGVIGGIYIFGIIGIFIGPLIFALLITLIEVYRNTEIKHSAKSIP